MVLLKITALPPAIANLLNRLLVKPPGGIFSLNKPLCVILHLQILAYGYEYVCLTQSHAVRLPLLRPFTGDRFSLTPATGISSPLVNWSCVVQPLSTVQPELK